jgi:DNA-binding response OmpR family regulator
MPEQILLVDDDLLLLDSVRFSLEAAGFAVHTAPSSAAALQLARRQPLDLAILDIGLPDGDGLRLCQSLQLPRRLPVIFLTAHDREMDVLLGFGRGADDYVTKPFSTAELIVRVGAVLRRVHDTAGASGDARGHGAGRKARDAERYRVGEVAFDGPRHEVHAGPKTIDLPPKEFELLKLLISRPGEAIPRQEIVDAIWGVDYFGDTRVLDVHIRWLRELLEADAANPRYILTVRGVGYKFCED